MSLGSGAYPEIEDMSLRFPYHVTGHFIIEMRPKNPETVL